jgi:hypothetical protein
MKYRTTILAACVAGALGSTAAFADGTADVVQRDVNQQQRIEQGLKSGELNTKEAGRLEREETHVDRMESNALKDGSMSAAEKARIEKTQNRVSRDIYRQKHDAQTGNPASQSSQRMQADVQRNVNQETRIENGVKSGQLTDHEAARLEGQQARVDRREARVARNGHISAGEQARVQRSENRASRNIARKKHNFRTRPAA